VSATINGRKEEPIFSYNKPISVEIRGLKFDKNSSRWNASLMFVSENTIVSAIPVAGRFDEMVELPVLKRQVRAGETIAEKDIQLRDFPASSTRSDAVIDLAGLIGKSPLRTISMNRPVREQELAMPTIVKKNSLVQMHYKSGAMQISDSGQAMEDGSKGSVISVKNVASKKTIRAMVVNADTVEVVTSDTQSSQLINKDAYEIN
jgi:flagella basal body P-ring formation protein FlgA